MHEPSAGQFNKPFNLVLSIAKSEVDSSGDWIISGPLSSQRRDLQGEVVLYEGLLKGLNRAFKKLGMPVDYDHKSVQKGHESPKYIVGQGIELFEGPARDGGKTQWLRTRLFKNKPLARELWEHKQNGGTLFYSIGGNVLGKTHTNDGPFIYDTIIKHVAITPYPANPDAEVGIDALAKSLSQSLSQSFSQSFSESFEPDRPHSGESSLSHDEPQYAPGMDQQSVGTGNGTKSGVSPDETSGAQLSKLYKALEYATVPIADRAEASIVGALEAALNYAISSSLTKTLVAGSGPGFLSSGARALVKEDVESKPLNTADPLKSSPKTSRKKSNSKSRKPRKPENYSMGAP